jgi:hypothetical protein
MLFGQRLLINHPNKGAKAPIKKKYVRPKNDQLVSAEHKQVSNLGMYHYHSCQEK